MRSDIFTVWKSHCGLGNQFVYIWCLQVLNVTIWRTQHIQPFAIPLPKFHTRSTIHPVKYTSHCHFLASLLFKQAKGQNTLQAMPFNRQTLEASYSYGLMIYTALVQSRITATLKEVLRTFPTFQTNALYLKTGQHRILLSVSKVTGHNCPCVSCDTAKPFT